MSEREQPTAELWAIVEVMGHAQYAGRVSEYTALGVPLVRVEIPETPGPPAHEKLLGAASIFRITPCTEETARAVARSIRVRPLGLCYLPSVEPGRVLGRPDEHDDEEEFPL